MNIIHTVYEKVNFSFERVSPREFVKYVPVGRIGERRKYEKGSEVGSNELWCPIWLIINRIDSSADSQAKS